MSLIYPQEAYKIIGACFEVHKVLGPGFLESVYQEALEKEFILRSIPYEREKQLTIFYKGNPLEKKYIIDYLCFDKIILELKATESLTTVHEAQLLNYLKATSHKLGLLVNFGTISLENKRIVL